MAGHKQNAVLGADNDIARQADGRADAAGAVERRDLAVPDGGGVYAAIEHLHINVLHLFQIAHAAPHHHAAVFGAGLDRGGQVAAHKGAAQDLIIQVAHNNIVFFQAVDHPLVAVAFPATAAGYIEHMLAQVRALGHKAAGHSTAVQLFVRVQRFQITLELEPVSAGVQRLPDFFLGQVF